MPPVRRRLVMAVGAREDRIIRRVGMAGRAYAVRAAMIHRKIRVIEGRSRPGDRRMARRAGGRETRRGVIRICGPVVVRLVA